MSNNKKRKIFSKLYDKYVERIYRFIFLKVNSREMAEDLCSETFLKAWEAYNKPYNPQPTTHNLNIKNSNPKSKIQNPKSNIENPQAFLYKIAKNLIIDYYRQKSRFKIISTEHAEFIPASENLEEKMDLDLDMLRVRTALSQLKDDYQEVVIWRYLNELSISEIAKILDKSEDAVRMTLSRALEKLREEFE